MGARPESVQKVITLTLYYAVLYPLSLLPLAILYRIADGLALLLNSVIPYRKKVILQNLERSFPEKSRAEIVALARGFQRHFADLLIESVKASSMSGRELQRRMVCVNPELIDGYFARGQSVLVAGGHYNNWEWFGLAAGLLMKHSMAGIYKPLSNRTADRIMRGSRERFGTEFVAMKETQAWFDRQAGAARPGAIVFASDQSPGSPSKAHWVRFLNQDTAAVFGLEKFAKQSGYPVIYGVIRKRMRGYYEFEFRTLTDDPRAQPHGRITEEFMRMLEADIRKAPEFWLWSHRRWKHSRVGEVR